MNDDRDKKDESEKGMPILIIKDHETKVKFARVVPRTGTDPYAINRLKKDIEQFGYNQIIIKSDQDNSIKALKQAVKEATYVQVKFQESPVGDYQGNGIIEHAVNDITNQFRAIKDGLDTRYGSRINGDHPAVPWLMKHAADTINRRRVGKDGKTPHRRWKGK